MMSEGPLSRHKIEREGDLWEIFTVLLQEFEGIWRGNMLGVRCELDFESRNMLRCLRSLTKAPKNAFTRHMALVPMVIEQR